MKAVSLQLNWLGQNLLNWLKPYQQIFISIETH